MKPNILIIVVDSMRADHVSCYGYDRPTTPNIDRLAAEGCLFETAITAAPFSPASYASIFSNLYPHQHGVNGDTVRVWPDTWPRLPERMRENGYYTFCVSNNSFVSEEMNASRGFDAFVGPQTPWLLRQYNRVNRRIRMHIGESAAKLVDSDWILSFDKGSSKSALESVSRFIRSAPSPYFGFVILMDPHALYNPRRRDFCGNSSSVKQFLKNVNGRQMWPRLMAKRGTLSTEQLQAAIDLYDSEILHADRCIGAFIDWLRNTEQLDNTVVIVTADHGEAFGEHGVWGHGFCLNDCLTRVPLVVRCPRYWQAGGRSQALVQLHDLHSLCLSVSETGEPRVDKHSHCLTQAADPHWTGRDSMFSEFPVQTGTLKFMSAADSGFQADVWAEEMWSVRSTDWRYIQYDGGWRELYNLETDPDELSSVANEYPNVCKAFAQRLAEHRDQGNVYREIRPSIPKTVIDESVLERLRNLGYME